MSSNLSFVKFFVFDISRDDFCVFVLKHPVLSKPSSWINQAYKISDNFTSAFPRPGMGKLRPPNTCTNFHRSNRGGHIGCTKEPKVIETIIERAATPGVGNLFSRRAALTIQKLAEGQ